MLAVGIQVHYTALILSLSVKLEFFYFGKSRLFFGTKLRRGKEIKGM